MISRALSRKIRSEFVYMGLSGQCLMRRNRVSERSVRHILERVTPVDDPGVAPAECRLGIYSGYRDVIEPILRKHGVTWAQFMGKSRVKRINVCRWQAYAELHAKGKKYLHIGQFVGRDHTTIIHAVRQYREGLTPYHGASK